MDNRMRVMKVQYDNEGELDYKIVISDYNLEELSDRYAKHGTLFQHYYKKELLDADRTSDFVREVARLTQIYMKPYESAEKVEDRIHTNLTYKFTTLSLPDLRASIRAVWDMPFKEYYNATAPEPLDLIY